MSDRALGGGAIDAVVRVGLFGVGLEAYWDQFEGLKERLEDYLRLVAAKVAREGFEVIDAGLVDSYESALLAGSLLRIDYGQLVNLQLAT